MERRRRRRSFVWVLIAGFLLTRLAGCAPRPVAVYPDEAGPSRDRLDAAVADLSPHQRIRLRRVDGQEFDGFFRRLEGDTLVVHERVEHKELVGSTWHEHPVATRLLVGQVVELTVYRYTFAQNVLIGAGLVAAVGMFVAFGEAQGDDH